jgi:glycine dehydrogenase
MTAVHPPFARRHIGTTDVDRAAMLAVVGADSLAHLIDQVVPASIRNTAPLALRDAVSEPDAIAALRRFAEQNVSAQSLIGTGYYGTITPPVVLRNVLENPAWYTAYTPYQPEISQGRLEALLNFQTMIADLAGLDLANASLLDEGTAAAEAMTLTLRAGKHSARAFFVDADTHPQTISVIRTRAEPLAIEVVVGDPATDLDPSNVFGALLSYPGSSGAVPDIETIAAKVHAGGGLVVVAADPLALVLLRSPGSLGADVVIGSSQRFGVPVGSLVHRPMLPVGPRCVWRCKLVSSTFAATRRRATSAPPRFYSRSSPVCTRCGTDPTVWRRLPNTSTHSPTDSPPRCEPADWKRRIPPGSTP